MLPFEWSPTVIESVDGKPLATIISELFWDFPYHRLQQQQQQEQEENNGFFFFFSSWLLNYMLRPEGMITLLIFYLSSKPLFQAIYSIIQPTKDKVWFTMMVAIHNMILTIFSFVVAYYSWNIVVNHYLTYGFWDMYCDPNGTMWSKSNFGTWAIIFYISKYYEFVDSWVLILKGKNPSFLQIYHHTGICFCMWIGVLSQSSWLLYVVLANSVIHTIMYTYFFIKTISPTTEIKAAKYLTRAQIGQFFSGIIFSFPILFLGNSCNSPSSRFGLWCLQFYGYGLVALFMSFAKQKYNNNNNNKSETSKVKVY